MDVMYDLISSHDGAFKRFAGGLRSYEDKSEFLLTTRKLSHATMFLTVY